jgi:hypothetical protein
MPIPLVLAANTGTPGNRFGAADPVIDPRNVDFGDLNGGRVEVGAWLDPRHTCGVEFGGFLLQERSREFAASSDAVPNLARPIFDPVVGRFNFAVADAGLSRGSVSALASTQLGSAEFNVVRNVAFSESWSFDALFGTRYIDLDEDLQVRHTTTGAGLVLNNTADFVRLDVSDRFRTRNQFWGGQVGARAEARRGIWFGSLTGKLGLGNNHQVSEVAGQTVGTDAAGTTTTAEGGLLALLGGPVRRTDGSVVFETANIGRRKTDWFAVAPEVGVQVGAQLTRSVRVHVGYNFLYINNVVRPGDLIDPVVNLRFVPSHPDFRTESAVAQPTTRTSRDDFIAHGVELGLGLQF